ncbi:MAG: hypothetical protein HN919_21720 [Verrucomicrobia bacterium]|jgi:hypothetical protein|nr:hypothetical protein [Verrucomicrobiota bacterium]MBT7068930.1 hypothetical protein [Verrucomicrobiota bacterium]MBT7701738.1 hypothetical protein [Verrucomicrobiota bacterium]
MRENTIVIFTSDHGDMLGDHGNDTGEHYDLEKDPGEPLGEIAAVHELVTF